ncbi:hypothetical protein Tco_0346761, partial [Tanacetum coccineum]
LSKDIQYAGSDTRPPMLDRTDFASWQQSYEGYQWKPTGRKFTLGDQCPLTRLTKSKVVPPKKTENVSTSKIVITEKLSHTSQKPLTRYQCGTKQYKETPNSIPTPTENEAIDASLHSTIASANQREPNKN